MIVDRLLAYFGVNVDQKDFDNAKKEFAKVEAAAKDLIDTVVSIKGAFAGAFAAAVGMTNAQTAMEARQAEAMGVSYENAKALTNALKGTGLGYENVLDIVEELHNKMGESMGVEEMTAVKEAFGMIGLEFEKIRQLKPEEQFTTIMNALSEMDDIQKAKAAGDILMGAEANKIVGQIRLTGKTYEELIAIKKKDMFTTEEGTRGATQMAMSMERIGNVTGSLWSDVAGVIGTAMAPAIETVADFISEFREFYKLNIKEHIGGITTAVQVLGIALGASIIGKFVKLGAAAASAAGSVGLIRGAVIGIRAALGGVIALFGGPVGLAITGAILLAEDLYYYFNGMPSLIGGIGDAFNKYVRPKVEEFTNWFGDKVQAILDMIPQGLKDALFPGGSGNTTATAGSYLQGGAGSLGQNTIKASAFSWTAPPSAGAQAINVEPKFDVVVNGLKMSDINVEMRQTNAATYRDTRKGVDY